MENGALKNRYVYGALNRLEQAVNAKGETALYTYNGLEHRVGKTTDIIHPEKIQYTIDLTKSYHNLLQKEEVGSTQSEMTGLFPKGIKIFAYVGAFIDAGINIKENIEKGSSWQRTSSDALVDLTIFSGTIYASIEWGGIIGTFIEPGGGTIIGAVAGLVIGLVLYYVTDVLNVKGKYIRDHIKDSISDYYGWD